MFRPARADDVSALRDLEREANLAALGHVFPPERFGFPDDAVLARWALVLEDPTCRTLVVDDDEREGRLVAYVASDDETLRHLAVHPDRWGQGLGTAAVESAVADIAGRGATTASLWCLEENRQARRLYEHLGWRAGRERRDAPWPPHPEEMRYELPLRPPSPRG